MLKIVALVLKPEARNETGGFDRTIGGLITMFIYDSGGVGRRAGHSRYSRLDDTRQNSIESIVWFQQGTKCLEIKSYDEALFCFEEAKRLGHPMTTKAIILCRKELGGRMLPDAERGLE